MASAVCDSVAAACCNDITAVIFDLGGVVVPSPVQFLIGLLMLVLVTEYEKRMGLPSGTFYQTIVCCTENSAWARWERGQLNSQQFADEFTHECSQLAGRRVDLRSFPSELETEVKRPGAYQPYPEVIESLSRLRTGGIKTALLTNNFAFSDGVPIQPVDPAFFDCVVESSRVEMRKPERRIYELTLRRLNVQPAHVVFLDDLDVNITAAQLYDIKHCIKVTNVQQAICHLQTLVGLPLCR